MQVETKLHSPPAYPPMRMHMHMPYPMHMHMPCPMRMQVETGLLSPQDYLRNLRAAIPKEKKKALAYKAAGSPQRAVATLKRAKLMEAELQAAAEGGIG